MQKAACPATSRGAYEFISKTNNDPIVQRRTCAISGKEFAVFQSDVDFYAKISPTFKGKKYQLPLPTLCPEERQRRRLLRRNERKLYRRKCEATGKFLISIYSENHPYKVYDEKIRRGDARDPLEYGFDFDFNKTFFQQFDTLMKNVPQANRMNFNNENSDYVNYMNDSKNCYLTFGSGFLEDCYYCNRTYYCKNLLDCGYCFRGENSYMCIKCEHFYHCTYCQESKSITDCNYCSDCENCTFCTGCVGLRGQQYCILNKKYSKEEYQKIISDMGNVSEHKEFLEAYQKLKNTSPKNAMNITSSENSCGNDIKNSQNAVVCYEVDELQDCKYCTEIIKEKDFMDVNNNGRSQLMYESIGFGYDNRLLFTLYCSESSDISYCAFCQSCKNLFACVNLKHKEYCIFNKQYTKEEYENLVPQIIEHMTKTGERGEFYPASMNYFGYNETVAHEYYPLSKEDALSKGYKWQENEYPTNVPDSLTIIDSKQMQNLSDEEILKGAIKCEVSGKPFRIVKPELEFYRRNKLPLPSKHPDIRHAERMAMRPPRELFLRTCDKCEVEMLSVYPQDSELKVFCEKCYNKEIYG